MAGLLLIATLLASCGEGSVRAAEPSEAQLTVLTELSLAAPSKEARTLARRMVYPTQDELAASERERLLNTYRGDGKGPCDPKVLDCARAADRASRELAHLQATIAHDLRELVNALLVDAFLTPETIMELQAQQGVEAADFAIQIALMKGVSSAPEKNGPQLWRAMFDNSVLRRAVVEGEAIHDRFYAETGHLPRNRPSSRPPPAPAPAPAPAKR